MAYRLIYHPAVLEDDLPSIPRHLHARLQRAIAQRLSAGPTYYGEPLRHHLKGYWKLRIGDYRVVYQVAGEEVWIYRIDHRKDVYDILPQRFIWRP